MIATAPGKLILTGEYAVLDGAPALVMAVDRRAIARRAAAPPELSPFLAAVADELAARRGEGDPAAAAARQIAVDSSAFFDVDGRTKLGLGSSAAVTTAAAALALAAAGAAAPDEVLAVALAAHAAAQGPRGARGSGADIAASVYGGLIAYTMPAAGGALPRIERRRWPEAVMLVPFFTGRSADTPRLVAQVAAARAARPAEVGAALTALADASRAAIAAAAAPRELAAGAVIAAFAFAGHAVDALARATNADLVPECVTAARAALGRLGGTAKTTGAGGGDIAVGVVPAAADVTEIARALIQAGCRPLTLSLDETGVDTRLAPG